MRVRRPELRSRRGRAGTPSRQSRITEAGGKADVIHQRIKPNVGHVIGIKRERNSPAETCGRTGDAKVLEGVVLKKPQHLVATEGGPDEIRVAFDVFNQP